MNSPPLRGQGPALRGVLRLLDGEELKMSVQLAARMEGGCKPEPPKIPLLGSPPTWAVGHVLDLRKDNGCVRAVVHRKLR